MSFFRIFQPPTTSFFLFGPRATGKSTWVQRQLKPDLVVDLLRTQVYRDYASRPQLLREILEANPHYRVVVIDEVQKLPELLDEVHSLLFTSENRIQFVLTGSSTRRIKRSPVNLLAGRALLRQFHQFSQIELGGQFRIMEALQFGLLPQIWNLETVADRHDYLNAYVDTYLREEIRQEALVRSLPAYASFLEHFAIRNGQVVNLQNLSKEIGVSRATLNGYLEILEQTMLGARLPPIQLQAKVKEVATPKFFFFDPGVVRALARRLDIPVSEDVGPLLETYVLHEMRTYSDYFSARYEFAYWATHYSKEVDFVVSRGRSRVGIEVKSSRTWHKEFGAGLTTLLQAGKIAAGIGVYLGDEIIKQSEITVYPVDRFIQLLYEGRLLSS